MPTGTKFTNKQCSGYLLSIITLLTLRRTRCLDSVHSLSSKNECFRNCTDEMAQMNPCSWIWQRANFCDWRIAKRNTPFSKPFRTGLYALYPDTISRSPLIKKVDSLAFEANSLSMCSDTMILSCAIWNLFSYENSWSFSIFIRNWSEPRKHRRRSLTSGWRRYSNGLFLWLGVQPRYMSNNK